MFRKMLIGAVALVALAATPAYAAYDLNVNPGDVEPGGDFTVSGEGCLPFEVVEITVTQVSSARAVGDVIIQTTTTADENGEFSVTLTIPAGTATGTYEVTTSCADVESALIDVVGATPPPPPGNGGNLPRTGSDLNKLGMVGVGLMTFGGLVLIATKVRRNEAKA